MPIFRIFCATSMPLTSLPFSRMDRDGRLASIGGGADEVMMGILSKIMGIAKRPQK